MRDHFSFPSASPRPVGGAFAAILSLLPVLLLQSCMLGDSGTNPATPSGGNGYFKIETALAGQGFDMDSSMALSWIASEAVQADSQRMDLYSGSRFIATLGSFPPGTGTFSWLPAVSIPATNYRLGSGIPLRFKITSFKDSTKWDFGPTFALSSKYSGMISIDSPASPSDVRMNSAFTIRWKASGNIGPDVGIQLFQDTAWAATLAPAPSGAGSVLWSPVQSAFGPGAGYRIRVFSRNDPGITALSAAFSISPLYAGGFVILSPAAGDTLPTGPGRKANIKWINSGDPGISVAISLLRDSARIATLGNAAVADDSLSWSPSPGLATSSHYRIKMVSQSDSNIVAYSKEFTVIGTDRDVFEPDDSLSAAKAIATDGSTQLRTLSNADEDWVRFSASMGKKYLLSLQVTAASASFPDSFRIYITDSAGNPRNYGVGSSIRMILSPTYAGDYFAKVKCPKGYGSYALSVNGYDTATAPYYVPFQAPNAKTVWPAGSVNTLAYSPDSTYFGSQVQFALYDDTTFIQTISTQGPNSGNYSWSIPGGLLTSSRYRIRISNYFNPSIFAFSETFTVNGAALDAYEPDNSPAAAKEIAATGSAQAHSLTLNDTDWVQFNAAAGKAYLITVNGSATTSAYVTDSAGTLAAVNSGTKYYVAFSPMRAGKYYARLQYVGGYGAALAYSISLKESDSAQGSAPVKFQAPADSAAWNSGSAYALAWTPDTALFGPYVSLALYGDSGVVQTLATSVANNGAYTVILPSGIFTSSRYRIRLASVSSPQLFGYSPYFTINGLYHDAYEPDNARATARNIATDGSPQTHTVTINDTDWVQFNAATGRSYLVTVNSGTSIYAYVLDSAGISYASAPGTKFSQVFTPTRAGKYYVRVQYYGGYTAYTLAVSEFETGKAAATVKFQTPTDSTSWNAGSVYSLAWTPDTALFGNYVSLSLYQDSTFAQTLATGVANNGLYSGSLALGLATSNHYRIRMASSANPQLFAYSPFFTLRGIDPDAYEPDNGKSAAKDIATDGVAQARTLSINDSDWVRFNATAGKSYLITINGSVYLYAYVLDSNGIQLSYNYGQKFSQTFTPTQSGKYYLRAQYYSGYGAYALTVTEFDASKGSAAAKFIAPSDTSTWAVGNYYSISWTPDTAVFGTSVNLSLYSDSTLIQTLASSVANNGIYSGYAPAGCVSSSRYRLRIANASNAQIYGYGPYFSVTGIAPDAYEPDNGKGSAKDIATDGVAQAHTLSLNDSDWIQFNAVAGKSYLVNINGGIGVLAYLLDSSGLQFGYNYGSKFSFSLPAARTGKYYVRVQNYSGYGNYSVSVQDFNPALGSAKPKFLAPDTSTTWASGGAYTVAWTPDTAVFGPYVSLGLYFDTTLIQSMATSMANQGSASVTLPSGLASSNHYRMRLANGNNSLVYGYGPYFSIAGIAADSLEPNDSAGAASPVVPNAAAMQLTLSSQDRDWFKFTAKAQQLYVIQANSNGSLATTLRLYSGIGEATLQTNYKTGLADSLNTIDWICPSDGQYAVSVEPYSMSSYGTYGFQIQEVDPSQYKFGVTGPAAAAVAHVGAVLPITWTDPSALKGQADIFLYDARGVVQTVASNVANTGSFNWTVPAGLPAGNAYFLKVVSRISASIYGTSAAFSIAP